MKTKKYRLKKIKKDETYTRCSVVGLKMAYYKDYKNTLVTFGGICGLLRSEKHKGYCYLCMTYHKDESNELPEPAYMVEFSPLYNEKGEVILIKYGYDDMCTSIDRGVLNFETREVEDCMFTFWNHGTFDGFKEG